MFKLIKQSKSKARLGQLRTRRGIIKTPSFMPIATKGAVKTLSSADLRRLNPDVILSNTYHLMLRPGEKELKRLGGLHKFMDWSGPILTDSGGFQVFSLAKIRKITEDGVKFSSHLDGKSFFLSPEDSIRIQAGIGADIMMVLDECVELPAEREYLEQSVELTTK
ncbi:tRNA-guanine transglycosylase, partial [Candidatus Falkowbacteria bacterium]|nr:tRNA-guanine transglycosylase [Candidatus Falkowbacteria bacterium]